MSPMVSTASAPSTRDGYYAAETELGLAAAPELWPAAAGGGAPLPDMPDGKVSDLQLALPKVVSSLWVVQPELRRGLEQCLAEAATAYVAEIALTSVWWRRTEAYAAIWEQAEPAPGTVWLHHLSRHLEPHLHLHLLLPERGHADVGERALVPSLLRSGRYAAAARAAAVVAAHLRAEGFTTAGLDRGGWLTLQDGPAGSDIPHLHALAGQWSTGRRNRIAALMKAAEDQDSLSLQAVRALDQLVDRTARPEWRGPSYNAHYGQLVEQHWRRTAAGISGNGTRLPRADRNWQGGLDAGRLYNLTAARDGRSDLRLMRERAWSLACHDPDGPAADTARAALVDTTVEECLAHRPIYAVSDLEARTDPNEGRARIVGRGLATQHWVAACDWLRRTLTADAQHFPRLVLAAGPKGRREHEPARPPGWTGRPTGRVTGLIAPSGDDQAALLLQLDASRHVFLAGPQGIDLTAPAAWLNEVRPAIPPEPLRSQPPEGEPGLCVVAAQGRGDVELADMARRWHGAGWGVVLVVDAADLLQAADTRSEALLWAKRTDGAAVLECRDMGPERQRSYGRRQRLTALLETGRPSCWQEVMRQCHVTTAAWSEDGIEHRLRELAALDDLPTTVIAPRNTLNEIAAAWPSVRLHTPRDALNGKVEPATHIVLALGDKPRTTPASRRLIVACRSLGTLLHVVSPWDGDTTHDWFQALRTQGHDNWRSLTDTGWDRLRQHVRPEPLPEPDRLHVTLRERPRGRVHF